MVVLKMAKRWTENLDKFQKSINLDKSRKIWICGSIGFWTLKGFYMASVGPKEWSEGAKTSPDTFLWK